MQRRVGTINCHVCVEGNARQVGHVAREVARLDVCVITETWLKKEQVDGKACAIRAAMTGSARKGVDKREEVLEL